MSDTIRAAESIREIANKLKGFQIVADALERVGSFEQAEQEAKAATLKAQEEAAKAQDDLTAARREAEDILARAEAAKTTALLDAEEIRRVAQEESDKVKADADAYAERVIESGKSKAAEHMRNVLAQVEAEEEKLTQITSQLDSVRAAKAEAEGELALVEAKLAQARASIANLLGQ